MNIEYFKTPKELSKYINDNSITAVNCHIVHNTIDNTWWLFWWT